MPSIIVQDTLWIKEGGGDVVGLASQLTIAPIRPSSPTTILAWHVARREILSRMIAYESARLQILKEGESDRLTHRHPSVLSPRVSAPSVAGPCLRKRTKAFSENRRERELYPPTRRGETRNPGDKIVLRAGRIAREPPSLQKLVRRTHLVPDMSIIIDINETPM